MIEVKTIFDNKINLSLKNGQEYLGSLTIINDITKRVKQLKNIKEDDKIDLKEILDMLSQTRKDEEYIQKFSGDTKIFICFKVDISLVKEELTKIVEQIFPNVYDCLTKIYKSAIHNTRSELENIKKQFDNNSEDIISYGNLLNTMKKFSVEQNKNIRITLEYAQKIYNEFFIKQSKPDIQENLNLTKQKYE